MNPNPAKRVRESIQPKSQSMTATINPREEVAVETEVEVQVEEVEEEAENAWYRQQAAAGDAAEDEARRPTMRRAPR